MVLPGKKKVLLFTGQEKVRDAGDIVKCYIDYNELLFK